MYFGPPAKSNSAQENMIATNAATRLKSRKVLAGYLFLLTAVFLRHYATPIVQTPRTG